MMCSLIILLTCICSWACDCKDTASIQERLLEIKDEFCLDDNICLGNSSTESSLVHRRHVLWSCCTECHCRSNCTEDNMCCFPPKQPEVIVKNPFGSLQIGEECLFPTTIQQNDVEAIKYDSFYMVTSVTKQRKTGSRVDTNIQCGDENVAPWGSMFPVYSSSKKTIYKNILCAEAHGVTDGSIWDAVVYCKSSKLNHIEALVNIIEFQEFDLRHCSVDFIPPHHIKGIKGLKCHASLINTCSENDFYLQFETGLSKIDVIEMCESGFVSPFPVMKLYANVFCFICNANSLPDSLNCSAFKYSFDENRETYKSGFIGLIDSTLIHPKSSRSFEHVKTPTVCDSKEGSRCRPLFCPTGQLRDKSGKCKYLNKLWYNQVYVVNINLTSERSFDINEINDITESLFGLTQPMWKRRWRIDSISYELNQEFRHGTSLLVILTYKTTEIRPQDLMRNVKRLLLQYWRLDLGNDTFVLKSSFSKSLMLYDNRQNQNFGNYSKHSLVPVHQVLYIDSMFIKNKYIITKLNLCKQVEISSSEFTLASGDEVLFNLKTQEYLFDGEFILFSRNNSLGNTARICIEDSGMFEIKNDSIQTTTVFYIHIIIGLIIIESFFGKYISTTII